VSGRGRRVGLVGGVVGLAAGAAVAGERLLARRLRATADPDGGGILAAEYERSRRIPAHDGGELFVVESGTGPVIVLVHGLMHSVRAWAKQLRSLSAAGYRVVAYDHRGHGDSELGPAGHGVGQIAADLRAVLEALDLRDVVIVGHSMGGIATQAMCIDHPEVVHARVAGIVLLSSLARSPFAGNPRLVRLATAVAAHLPDTSAVLRARDLGLVLTRAGFGRSPAPSHVEVTRQMLLATDAETRRDAATSLAGLNLMARLHEIHCPTLVIGGSADVIAPVAESRRIAAAIPGARLEVLDGGGHMLMFEQADVLDRLVIEFARSVQGRHHDAVESTG